jgi:Putative DNA-binding domain
MTLAELQERAAAAIMAPLTAEDGMAAKWRVEADALIKPNGRMAPLERLEIYGRSYWFRILDCLYEDFPGLSAAIGKRAFQRLSRAYLTVRPSESFSLRNLGAALEEWLGQHPEYAGRHFDLALDMVRLEWAHIEAFDGPARKPLGPEDLLELGPELKLDLQPHITLLELKYPVDDLRIAVSQMLEEHDSASNAVAERAQRRTVRRYRRLQPQLIHLAAYRAEDSVWYRRLDRDEYLLLSALRQGLSIGEAVEKMAQTSELREEQLSAAVQQWFAAWAHMGWLCAAIASH